MGIYTYYSISFPFWKLLFYSMYRRKTAGFALLHALLVSLDHLFDHLAADGTCLTGGQVTVVTIGQVDAHFGCSLHLEAVHCLTGLRNIDLIVVLHSTLSFCLRILLNSLLSWKAKDAFPQEIDFSFRKASFTRKEKITLVSFRKIEKKMEK